MSASDNIPSSSANEENAKATAGQDVGVLSMMDNPPSESHEAQDKPEAMEAGNGELQHINPSPLEETAVYTSPGQAPTNEGQVDPEQPEPLRISTHLDVPPPPPQKDEPYIDPTPKTPQAPRSPVNLGPEYTEKELPDVPKDCKTELPSERTETQKTDDDQSEIQSIMGQFSDEANGPGETAIMSPRLELAEQFLNAPHQFPPRRSSLEHLKVTDTVSSKDRAQDLPSPISIPPKLSHQPGAEETLSPRSASMTGPPPPESDPDQPFDFHRFLEQLRHRTADPVAKFLRSFLTEFGKKQWLVHEQVKIISDFLAFITNKMAQCEVWKHVSDAEFDNAKEGMEKLVMNRLYSQTFSPAIPPPPTIPRTVSRGKRRELERLHGPGRRGQHQEDVERDEILAQKIRIYSWIREEHLDIQSVGNNGRRFLSLAQQEILKIKGYRAPRDKIICILNCCKVIFGLLKHSKNPDTSADSFVPLLIYTVLRANPENLVSNVQYILRFRNQEKLGGEAGYYLSSLSGAIQFIETLDRTSLTVSDEEFEANVEAAVSDIAKENLQTEVQSTPGASHVTPRPSTDAERYPQGRDGAGSGDEDNASVTGLLRTIQKPLSTIGRIFSEDQDVVQDRRLQQEHPPPVPSRPSPGPYPPERQARGVLPPPQIPPTIDAQEAAARQASAEAAEARRIQHAEHQDVVETLSGMFPNLDKDVIDDVVRMNEGRVGLAVDACLALSAE